MRFQTRDSGAQGAVCLSPGQDWDPLTLGQQGFLSRSTPAPKGLLSRRPPKEVPDPPLGKVLTPPAGRGPCLPPGPTNGLGVCTVALRIDFSRLQIANEDVLLCKGPAGVGAPGSQHRGWLHSV